jgi:hypothetical protein
LELYDAWRQDESALLDESALERRGDFVLIDFNLTGRGRLGWSVVFRPRLCLGRRWSADEESAKDHQQTGRLPYEPTENVHHRVALP